MTPKEKAKELTDKYFNVGDQEFDYSKEFALIAVDEMISVLPFTNSNASLNEYAIHLKRYLDQVKHEIEKL